MLLFFIISGNPLIDDYGKNNFNAPGENGLEVQLPENMRHNLSTVMEKYRINTIASDIIPLNRMVPDSRFKG